jgi:hypothetical protein
MFPPTSKVVSSLYFVDADNVASAAFGNSIRHMGAYAPATRKNIFKPLKNSKQKNYHVNLGIICVHDKFPGKPPFIVSCVKRQKKSLVRSLFHH